MTDEVRRYLRKEFLKSREEKAEDPILKVAGILAGEPLSEREIDEELYGKEDQK